MLSVETVGYKLNHTMLRVKDPKASLKFYCEILGMELIEELAMTDFTLYFIGYNAVAEGASSEERRLHRRNREGVLELWHDHGTERNPSFEGYASGNEDPGRGFGHIAISVPDIQTCCARLESLGVPFKKRLTDGRMKNIAFCLDPDGYWIEVVPQVIT
ncbi:glyoxalase I [Phanerochaete sordida]|uniref:Lactoylglutathione lyase n=1 Tax=Phanerochaete sordida TaxID=48140 RepID=A0A9P3LCC4_9APHY|nr:glyoxalase I [Phanerochaete sordida]